MKYTSFTLSLCLFIPALCLFSACGSDNNADGNSSAADSVAMGTTPEDSASLFEQSPDRYDGSDPRGPGWYTYNYTEEEVLEEDIMDETTSTPSGGTSKNQPTTKVPKKSGILEKPSSPVATPKLKPIPAIYTVSQTDSPPLFSTKCATAKNPDDCSNRALAEWAKENVKYPDADLAQGSDGLEYVTFVINQRGKVSSIRRLETKQEACEGCSQAVLDAMLEMPDWQPAMLNGKPVSVVVTLPVRFRSL